MDVRKQVLEAFVDLLQWDRRKALQFLDLITEDECDQIVEHVRQSQSPIVGVAAVVYRIRMRLAGDDPERKRHANEEAQEHYRLIPKECASGKHATEMPNRQETPVYRVAARDPRRNEV